MADLDWKEPEWKGLTALFALAARCTEQRDIDVDNNLRQHIGAKMREAKADIHLIRAVETFVAINNDDREVQFGESLPAGLILINRP